MSVHRIGKYRIIAKLGHGGMAKVFLAVAPGPAGFNKLLVIKVLKDELVDDADFLAMFLNEARLAARLNHPNVVHTYEVGDDGRTHFLVMDYLDGQPLHNVLRRAHRARMPLEIHVRILADALAGLHYAHTLRDFDGTPLKVVHRDVSPQNVFVTYDGQAKVVDFGIAKAAGAASNTQSGVFKGKVAYVAPEQAGLEQVDARADVFSVGVMLWEAIAATRFAAGESQTAILGRRLAGMEPRIRDVEPRTNPELAAICDKAMALKPVDRYQTAQELSDALDRWLDKGHKRTSTRDVAELMNRLFPEEREAIRQVIEAQMKEVLQESSTSLPVPSLDLHAGAGDPTPLSIKNRADRLRDDDPTVAEPSSVSGRFHQMAADATPSSVSGRHGTLATSQISQAPVARRSPRGAALAAGVAALLVGAAAALFVFRKPPLEAPPADPTAASSPAATTPSTDRIKLSVTFGPPGATAKLDGVVLAQSPFVAQVPRDGSMHRIEVEGEGLASETRMVSFEKDVSLDFMLQPLPIDLDAPAGSAAAGAPRAGGGWRPPPADPKGKEPKQPRDIDEQDPYKK
jgi:serine/threonine-protein kinase